MFEILPRRILRLTVRNSNAGSMRGRKIVGSSLGLTLCLILSSPPAAAQRRIDDPLSEMTSLVWDFSRHDDPQYKKWPLDWKRFEGVGYPNYVRGEIAAIDPELEQTLLNWDSQSVRWWRTLRNFSLGLPPLPPSLADAVVDRFFRVELDGGQFGAQSPPIQASRRFQYRFSCRIMTRGLKYDSALAEFLFLDREGNPLQIHTTEPVTGTSDWQTRSINPVQPPFGATHMMVRIKVQHGEDGLEDVRGTIGFDDVRIDRLPQLAIATDKPLGIYQNGEAVVASANILGLPGGESDIRFQLIGSGGELLAEHLQTAQIESDNDQAVTAGRATADSVGTAVTWRLPPLGPGFYRVVASVEGRRVMTLASETTFAVVDQLVSGPPHGCFGWTLPRGREEVPARQFAAWLAGFGVAWAKYPSWIAAENVELAEETTAIFSRLQDQGIETIGLLDQPPESQLSQYDLRGRRELSASQLFRDQATWQPLLEPIMTRMTLKVRRWQLGGDRDHSFLGRPRLNESIAEISSGLQGFGQPIDVAISWPWEEAQRTQGKPTWQAECRSSDPPLSARELDAYLTMRALNRRGDVPKTWLLLDPISKQRYSLDARLQDLVLRMATVRSHRVQAAFVSDPRDPDHGLLRPDGRPDELLLAWRTTARLIGNLRRAGSLQLRHEIENVVFTGQGRAVLMLWSTTPKQERIFLGEHVQMIDLWGRATELPVRYEGTEPAQVVETGPVPIFIVGADPDLLAFRMSVRLNPPKLDSLVGQTQKLTVSLTNATRESLVGDLEMVPPGDWTIDMPKRQWQALAGRTDSHSFDVALSNTAMIGNYEVPLRFALDTIPPKQITVYRKVDVGPDGIEVSAKTRLLDQDELVVQVEFTNRTANALSLDCMLFPPPGRQFQERVITLAPGATIRRNFFWLDAKGFLGQQMKLRAVEQDGQRVINYGFTIRG